MKQNKQNLTNLEKTRLKFANKEFLIGCEKFIQKCLSESNTKKFKNPFRKTIKEIKEQKDDTKKNKTYKTIYFLLGGLVVGITALPFILEDKLKKVIDMPERYEALYNNYIQSVETMTDKMIHKTNDILLGHAKKIGSIIGDNAKKFASFGHENFYSQDFRERGIFMPLMEMVAQTGLFWTLTLGGLGFLAELFGINEPSFQEIKYGIFAELARDQNVYFHRADGKQGIEGAQQHVKGLDVLKDIRLAGIPDFEEFRGENDVSGDYYYNKKAFDEYIKTLGQIQDVIDKVHKSGSYNGEVIQKHIDKLLSQGENINQMVTVVRRGWHRPDTAMIEYVVNQKEVQIKSGRRIWLLTDDEDKENDFGEKFSFVNDSIIYIDNYLYNVPYGLNPNIDKLRNTWLKMSSEKWRIGDIFKILSFVPIIAQHEVYAAHKSVVYMTSFYDNYYKESQSNKFFIAINKHLLEINEIRDEAADLYSRGVITLNEYIKQIEDKLSPIMNTARLGKSEKIFNKLRNNLRLLYSEFFTDEDFRNYIKSARNFVQLISEIGAMSKYGASYDNTIILGNTLERKELASKVSDRQKEERTYTTNAADYVSTDVLADIQNSRISSDERVSLFFETNKSIDERIAERRLERYELISLLLDKIDEN